MVLVITLLLCDRSLRLYVSSCRWGKYGCSMCAELVIIVSNSAMELRDWRQIYSIEANIVLSERLRNRSGRSRSAAEQMPVHPQHNSSPESRNTTTFPKHRFGKVVALWVSGEGWQLWATVRTHGPGACDQVTHASGPDGWARDLSKFDITTTCIFCVLIINMRSLLRNS